MYWVKLTDEDSKPVWVNLSRIKAMWRQSNDLTKLEYDDVSWSLAKETPEEILELARMNPIYGAVQVYQDPSTVNDSARQMMGKFAVGYQERRDPDEPYYQDRELNKSLPKGWDK